MTGAADMATELTVQLLKPVEHASETYTELQLSEPTAGQMIDADKAGAGLASLVKLISMVAAIPHGAALKIGRRDLWVCERFFGSFDQLPQPTPDSSAAS